MLVCGGWLVVRNAGDLEAAVSDLGTTVIVVSFALGVLGTVAIRPGLGWSCCAGWALARGRSRRAASSSSASWASTSRARCGR